MSTTKPYCPSNGTEGYLFMERFCWKCVKDEGQDCPILLASWIFDVTEDGYPSEWVMDMDEVIEFAPPRTAQCTAFVGRMET